MRGHFVLMLRQDEAEKQNELRPFENISRAMNDPLFLM